MRIQIIKLEKHDDVISSRDKLAWGKTARLLLVWPGEGRILTRRIDLVILQRYCQSQGSQLGLVSQDPLVQENARLLGIPIFSTETKALKARWNKRKPLGTRESHALPDLRLMGQEIRANLNKAASSQKSRWYESRWVRLGFFTVAILSVLVLAGVFYPSATIELSPETKTQEIILPLLAGSQIKAVNISGSLPARTIVAVVEGQDKIPVTGNANIPDQYAFGEVQFTNLSDQPVNIPVGTIVDDIEVPNARFITTKACVVEAGTGKTALIPIRALQPGIVGNLPVGAIDAIEGPLGMQLSVTNLSPTTGGSDKTVPAVSASDYDNLRTRLIQSLKQTAYLQIGSKLSPGDLLIQATLDVKNILEEESDPGINQPADNLSISLRIEYAALYISGEDLKSLGTANLDANLGRDFHPVAGSLKIETMEDPQVGTDQVIQWKIKASRLTQLNLPDEQVTGMVLGMTPEGATRKLAKELPLTTTPRVKMTPNWWPQLPILAFRISISQGSYADSGG
jgi:hypothetical protein